MTVVAVGNLKGGVGKTSLAVNVACALSKRFCEVLLIDIDPQSDASNLLAANQSELFTGLRTGERDIDSDEFPELCHRAIVQVRPGLSVLPLSYLIGSIGKFDIDSLATSGDFLEHLLLELSDRFDYAVIDTPPSWTKMQEVVARISDLLLTPVDPSEMSVRAAIRYLNFVSDIADPHVLLVRTLVQRRATGVARYSLNKIDSSANTLAEGPNIPPKRVKLKGVVSERLNISLSQSPIYRSERAHVLSYRLKTVFEDKTLSRLQQSYESIAQEIETLLGEEEELVEESSDFISEALGL